MIFWINQPKFNKWAPVDQRKLIGDVHHVTFWPGQPTTWLTHDGHLLIFLFWAEIKDLQQLRRKATDQSGKLVPGRRRTDCRGLGPGLIRRWHRVRAGRPFRRPLPPQPQPRPMNSASTVGLTAWKRPMTIRIRPIPAGIRTPVDLHKIRNDIFL